MIAASEDKTSLCLQLQGLPCSTDHLNSSPSMRRDNTPILILASFPVYSNMWDGVSCSGPIPVLFSSDPENAITRYVT